MPIESSSTLCVAYSGGIDSTVLLHIVSQIAGTEVVALHCDHGLHCQSANWAMHCKAFSNSLKVQYIGTRLTFGEGDRIDEQMARQSRYKWLASQIVSNQVLLTAHHKDDQAETLLLNLLRGAGSRGLSGIQPVRKFGEGWLARPLLEVSKKEIQDYAKKHHLSFVEDPSNQDTSFDRNYIRHLVIPKLGERWPGAVESIAQSAKNLRSSRKLLEDLGKVDLSLCKTQETGCLYTGTQLSIENLKHLSRHRQINLLRYWIRSELLSEPGKQMIDNLLDTVVHGTAQAGEIEWNGVKVCRFQNKLFLVPYCFEVDSGQQHEWHVNSPLQIENVNLQLVPEFVQGRGIKLIPELLPATVRFRAGGERIQLPGRKHSSSLKKVFQEYSIPPWERKLLPIVYFGEEIVAVPPYFVSAKFLAKTGERGVEIRLMPSLTSQRIW